MHKICAGFRPVLCSISGIVQNLRFPGLSPEKVALVLAPRLWYHTIVRREDIPKGAGFSRKGLKSK